MLVELTWDGRPWIPPGTSPEEWEIIKMMIEDNYSNLPDSEAFQLCLKNLTNEGYDRIIAMRLIVCAKLELRGARTHRIIS